MATHKTWRRTFSETGYLFLLHAVSPSCLPHVCVSLSAPSLFHTEGKNLESEGGETPLALVRSDRALQQSSYPSKWIGAPEPASSLLSLSHALPLPRTLPGQGYGSARAQVVRAFSHSIQRPSTWDLAPTRGPCSRGAEDVTSHHLMYAWLMDGVRRDIRLSSKSKPPWYDSMGGWTDRPMSSQP